MSAASMVSLAFRCKYTDTVIVRDRQNRRIKIAVRFSHNYWGPTPHGYYDLMPAFQAVIVRDGKEWATRGYATRAQARRAGFDYALRNKIN